MALIHSLLKNSLLNSVRNHFGVFSRLLHGPYQSAIMEPLLDPARMYIKLPEYKHQQLQMHVKSKNNCNMVPISSLCQQYFTPLQHAKQPDFTIHQSSFIKEYVDPVEHLISSIKEPFMRFHIPLEAAKSDLPWRKRRMRRHKMLRWMKKNPHIVMARLKKKLENRKEKQSENLEKSWKMFGLTEEPPPLTEEEKSKLEHEWRNEGIWTDPLTVDEYKSFDKITGIMKRTDKK